MNNGHIQFWITLGSLVTFIMILIFILIMAIAEKISFYKQYCILLIPILIYSMVQFIINYGNLTEDKNDKH